jgi:hypothetical protein
MKKLILLSAILLLGIGCTIPTPSGTSTADTLQVSFTEAVRDTGLEVKALSTITAQVDSVFRSNANSSAKGKVSLPAATATDSFRFKWTLCVQQLAGVDAACGTRVTGWTKRVVAPPPVDTTPKPPVDTAPQPPIAGWPNAPTSPEWKSAVDWTATLPPVERYTYAPDNGSGLTNYSAAWWDQNGVDIHKIVDSSGFKVLRATFPKGMWGVQVANAPRLDPDKFFYEFDIPQGAVSFDVLFKTPTPDIQYEERIYPIWSGWGDVDWTRVVKRTDGETIAWKTPAPAGAKLWYANGWGAQGPSHLFGTPLNISETIPQTGHIYVGAVVRMSPNFSVVGTDGLRLVGQKLFYLNGGQLASGDWANPAIVGVSARDASNPSLLSFTYTNQYDGRDGERLFFNVDDASLTNINDGKLHTIELLISPNTTGQADGTMIVWLDGREIARKSGLAYFGTAAKKAWIQVGIVNPYGGGFAQVPKEQYIDYRAFKLIVK